MISSIDEISAEDKSEARSLFVSCCSLKFDPILCSNFRRYSSVALDERDCHDILECFE